MAVTFLLSPMSLSFIRPLRNVSFQQDIAPHVTRMLQEWHRPPLMQKTSNCCSDQRVLHNSHKYKTSCEWLPSDWLIVSVTTVDELCYHEQHGQLGPDYSMRLLGLGSGALDRILWIWVEIPVK